MNITTASILVAATFAVAPRLAAAADLADAPVAPALVALGTAAPCQAERPLTALQQRIAAKADEGVDSLRNFVFITRGVYGLDMNEIGAWLGERQAMQRECVAVASNARR